MTFRPELGVVGEKGDGFRAIFHQLQLPCKALWKTYIVLIAAGDIGRLGLRNPQIQGPAEPAILSLHQTYPLILHGANEIA